MIEIFHVSDLHFGMNKAWTKKAEFLLRRIKQKFGIEPGGDRYLLVTGDIVQHGWKRQYKKARLALSAFHENVGIAPGNHDYGFQGFVYREKSAKYFDNDLAKELGINHPYISKKPFSKIVKDKEGNKVLLIGLNSCSMTKTWLDIAKGDIGDKQRKSLDKILSNPAYKDIPKIIYLHHIPHRRAQGIGMSLKDYKKLMAIVRDRVDALTFGHEGSMEELEPKDIKKKKLSEQDYKKWISIKKMSIPIREMKLRSGKGQGIRYYLDANKSVKEQACYHIKVEGNEVKARLVRLT
jgi:hypothetical protein